MKNQTRIVLALGTALAATAAVAAENPFHAASLERGYMVADAGGQMDKAKDGNCGAAKETPKAKDGNCGAAKETPKAKDGSCGAAKETPKAKDGTCGASKDAK